MRMNELDIENIIENINNSRSFSGVVFVQQGRKVIFQKAYGFANRSEEIPNNIDTRFGIASGCKVFTAIAISQLVEKGFLSFDTRLKDCISDNFKGFSENISIHHLLTHSSGIPDYFDEETMEDYSALWNSIPMYRMEGLKDFIPMFEGIDMKFEPGNRFHYNNAGFIVLGLIIEKITGIRFTEYIESNIFKPCGMDSSGYFSLDRLPQNTAHGYIEDPDGSWKSNIYSIPIIGGPDGGAFVTARDMIKFWEAFFQHRLLSKEYSDKLLMGHIAAGEGEYYGYGIWIKKVDNEVFKYHLMGGDPGVSFRSSVYPKRDIQIVVIGNKEYGSFAITKEIENKLIISTL